MGSLGARLFRTDALFRGNRWGSFHVNKAIPLVSQCNRSMATKMVFGVQNSKMGSTPSMSWRTVIGFTIAAATGFGFATQVANASSKSEFYNISIKDIDGNEFPLERCRGKVVLIVNLASECGFTKSNYTELQELYKKYHDAGLEILGIPCNQFGQQEPANNATIKKFAQEKFGVSFPLLEKVEVNGANAHPLFAYLKQSLPGFLGTQELKWNFTK